MMSAAINGINAGFPDCPDQPHMTINNINDAKLINPYNFTNPPHFFI